MEEMSKNEYPIIIIESLNKGGNTNFSLIFQKVLNYNSAKTKVKISFGINKEIIELINNKIPIYNIETCKREKIKENEINIDEYEKELKHYRTKIYLLTNSKVIEDELKKYKFKNRKPTEIIIFTDGFSFSTTSFFIKDIQESGNAIIVGYNGIPTKQKKKKINLTVVNHLQLYFKIYILNFQRIIILSYYMNIILFYLLLILLLMMILF